MTTSHPHAGDVSIVIPTFNRRHTLARVIDTYLNQARLRELIIVVDGSTDGTCEWLQDLARKEPRLRFDVSASRTGVSAARNRGTRMASGQYILFGEDDLHLGEGYAATLVDHLEHGGADIIAGRIIYTFDGETVKESIGRCDRAFRRRAVLNRYLMSVCYQKELKSDTAVPTLHAVSLARAETFKRLPFNETYHYREETELCLRALSQGLKILLCPHAHCFHLPRDRGKGGGWSESLFTHHVRVMESNDRLVTQYYDVLKAWGMRGNRLSFMAVHAVNRLRLLYTYFRPVLRNAVGAHRQGGTPPDRTS